MSVPLVRGAWFLAWAAVVQVVVGCAPSWPTVRPVVDPQFAAGQAQVDTIDLLPVDVEVGVHKGSSVNGDALARLVYAQAYDELEQRLVARGYEIRARMDWEGFDGDQRILYADEVAATAGALAVYAAEQAARPALTAPVAVRLPARLGVATSSDATLYLGGYAYHGEEPGMPLWGKILIGVVIVAVVVVIIVAVATSSRGGGGGGKGGGGGGKGGGGGGGGGGLLSGLADAAGNAASAGARVLSTVGRATLHAAYVTGRLTANILAHSDVYPYSYSYSNADPNPSSAPKIPSLPTSGRSRLYLELTLVSNHTGRVLWHAADTFPAHPTNPVEIRRAIRALLADLPTRPPNLPVSTPRSAP